MVIICSLNYPTSVYQQLTQCCLFIRIYTWVKFLAYLSPYLLQRIQQTLVTGGLPLPMRTLTPVCLACEQLLASGVYLTASLRAQPPSGPSAAGYGKNVIETTVSNILSYLPTNLLSYLLTNILTYLPSN